MSGRIFISYRRDDAKAEARSIFQHLQPSFGRDGIFMDVDSIQKGLDFTKVLDDTLRQTSVMLVIIGRTWLHQQDELGRRRLDDLADYVRLEIATALKRDIPVIPVRVDGARMPAADELPEDLKALVRRQGTVITHENFDSDIHGLEEDLRRLVVPVKPATRLPVAIAAGLVVIAVAGGAAWYLRAPMPPAAPAAPTAQIQPQIAVSLKGAGAQTGSSQTENTVSDTGPALRAAAAWAEAQRSNTFESYRAFMRAHPTSPRHKDAAEAAVPLLVASVERRLELAIANAKRRDGTVNGYIGGPDPRVMAMCIEWPGTSHETLLMHAWGSSQAGGNTSMTIQEREKTAVAFCSNGAPDAQRCTCEVVHRNGKPALTIPQNWIARQLR
jgi:hypothetical protein